MKSNITVVDSIMGSGKSSYFMQYMKERPNEKFMYISPYLDEVKRIKEEVGLVEPRPIKGSKLNHIRELTAQGRSTVSTHALLGRFDLEIQENIKISEYTLILDEVANVVEQFTFNTQSDKDDFFTHYAYIDNDGYCIWDEEKHPVDKYSKGSKFYEEMCLCLNKNLVQVDDKLLMWELPIEIFKKFKEVIILTYLFEGSVQKPYFDNFGIEYQLKSIRDGKLIPYEETSLEDKQKLKSLINIVSSPKLDEIGEKEFDLSSSWYKAHIGKPIYVERLKANLINFFTMYTKAKSKESMWSTFNDYKNKLKGKGYTKGFCACNIRATNDYRECYALAYTLNVFPHYSLTRYFSNRGMKEINKDFYALSILLQWIWRSRIRNINDDFEQRKIDLYLPSSRMKRLLLEWLDN